MGNMIKKAGTFEILNHWTAAISFLILAVSGFGFLYHLEQLNIVFGSFHQMKTIHNYAGIVFAVSLLITAFHYLPEALKFSSEDIAWFLKGGGYFSKSPKVPPQGKLNAGQKAFYLLLLVTGILLTVSGFVMWLLPGVVTWVLLSHLLHNITFVLLLIVVPSHIYLATLANPGTLRVMIKGDVPLEWARKRHEKWVKEMGQ
jgi:formate dehydrogenase subunit gamma